MRAVWSHWSKPERTGAHRAWLARRTHLMSWVLSIEAARDHCDELALVTDSEGARLLVDGLNLPFTEVSTELDALDDVDPHWWALGKLFAYRAQTKPFVHLDSDVYLWNPLPERLSHAAVFAQSPEPLANFQDSYAPERVQSSLRERGGWVPAEWLWYMKQRDQCAACCGILGGADVALIQHYASVAIRACLDPRNRPGWQALGNVGGQNMLVEQYLVSACVEHQRAHCAGDGPRLEYLFPHMEFHEAAERGYTHLIAGAKRNPTTVQRLEALVQREYPEAYARCRSLAGELESMKGEVP